MVTANHLDVGVGTGYFLDRCYLPSQTPRVALMDLNSNTLEFTSRRIARYNPKTYRRNILDPINLNVEKFDSVEESITCSIACQAILRRSQLLSMISKL